MEGVKDMVSIGEKTANRWQKPFLNISTTALPQILKITVAESLAP